MSGASEAAARSLNGRSHPGRTTVEHLGWDRTSCSVKSLPTLVRVGLLGRVFGRFAHEGCNRIGLRGFKDARKYSYRGGDVAAEAKQSAKKVRQKCELIIHGSAAAAGAAAAATLVPGADSVAIMPIQVAMVAALSKEHGIALSSSLAKSTVYASLGSIVGKAGAGLLLRWTPVAGNLIRASVAFSVTEALGHMVLERLESGEALP